MTASNGGETENEMFIRLYKGNLVPLYTVREYTFKLLFLWFQIINYIPVASLVWVLHDYLATVQDEIKYIWPQKRGIGKFMFFWIRYYTIFLLAFDTLQIHGFAIPGVANNTMCVAADPVTRTMGAISLWSVEIIMQLRIYAIFKRSKRIAAVNLILFTFSIGFFAWLVTLGAMNRSKMIAHAIHLPLPGCPAINGGTQWAQWIPATIFEFVLFGFVLYKCVVSATARLKLNGRVTLIYVLIHENTIYFFIVSCVLVFNNLMAIGTTRIPWFSFGPFHAALGIMTSRMLIHLRKFSMRSLEGGQSLGKFPDLEGGPDTPIFLREEAQPRESFDSDFTDDVDEVILHDEEESIAEEEHSTDQHFPNGPATGEAGPSRIV